MTAFVRDDRGWLRFEREDGSLLRMRDRYGRTEIEIHEGGHLARMASIEVPLVDLMAMVRILNVEAIQALAKTLGENLQPEAALPGLVPPLDSVQVPMQGASVAPCPEGGWSPMLVLEAEADAVLHSVPGARTYSARAIRIGRALGLTPTGGAGVERRANRWWLVGFVEDDHPVPQSWQARTVAEALDAAEAWLAPELTTVTEEGDR